MAARRLAAAALGCLLGLLLAAVAAAQPAFPPLTGRVVDEASILDAALEQRLSGRLEAFERATGNQVVVATLRSLQGRTVEEFANLLYRHWRLGRADEDDGALLVVAPAERKVRIEVGYGLEGVLTDAAAATIVQSLVLPRFRAGDLPGGVEAGAAGLLELLRPEGGDTATAAPTQSPSWSGQPRPQAPAGGPSWLFVLPAFIAFILLARALNRSRHAQWQQRQRTRSPWGQYAGRRRRGGYGFPPMIVLPGGFGGRGGGGFGGGGGGGGFSGGGGSSGGGGASGSW